MAQPNLWPITEDCAFYLLKYLYISIHDLCTSPVMLDLLHRGAVGRFFRINTKKSFKLKPKRIYHETTYNELVAAALQNPNVIRPYVRQNDLLARLSIEIVAIFTDLSVVNLVVGHLGEFIVTLTIDAKNFDRFQSPAPTRMRALIQRVALDCPNLTNLELVDIFSINIDENCYEMFSRLQRFMFLNRNKCGVDHQPFNTLLTQILSLDLPELKELELIGLVDVPLTEFGIYPKLQSIALKCTEISLDDVQEFLQNHSKLKSFTYWTQNGHPKILDDILEPEILEVLSLRGTDISEESDVYLDYNPENDEPNSSSDFSSDLTANIFDRVMEMSNLKILEFGKDHNIRGMGRHMATVDTNRLLEGLLEAEAPIECILLAEVKLNETSCDILGEMNNLKILKLTDMMFKFDIYMKLARKLSRLSELHVNSCNLTFNGAFDFVANSTSYRLTTIVYYHLNGIVNNFVIDLNRFRVVENILQTRQSIENHLRVYMERGELYNIVAPFSSSQYVKFVELTKEQIRTTIEFGWDGRINYNY